MSTRIFFRGAALVISDRIVIDRDTGAIIEPPDPIDVQMWLTTKELRASLIAMALVPCVAVLGGAFILTGAPLHLLGALCGGWLAVDSWREARLAHWFREHGCQRSAPAGEAAP